MEHPAEGFGHSTSSHVDTNPWPPVGAFGLVLMLFGLGVSFKARGAGLLILVVAAVIALVGVVGWWHDLIREAQSGTLLTANAASSVHRPAQDMQLGMILFIASEIMFFGAFFAFYFYVRYGAKTWPPVNTPAAVESLALPSLMTLLLVASSFTYTYGEHSLMRQHRSGLVAGLGATVLLGSAFLGLQAWEWSHSPLSIQHGVLGTAFYMLTGFHGTHVLVGVIFILVNFWRALRGHFSRSAHFAIQGAGWYWHFVDVVWLLLFFFVLYVPAFMQGS